MKIKFYYAFSVFMLMSVSFSCSREENKIDTITEQKESNNSNIVAKLVTAKGKMKKLDTSFNKMISLKDIENKYRLNLEIINKETGLNLQYNEEEFQTMIASLDKEYLDRGFIISTETHKRNLSNINRNGSELLFNQASDILKKIYTDNLIPEQSRRGRGMSRGCALAVAGNFLATLGLSACITGAGCPVAVAAKVLAVTSVIDSCS